MTVHKQMNTAETESLLKQVQVLGTEVREVVRAHLELAGMEARRAGESFVRMIALSVIAACLTLTAWALFVTAAVIAVVSGGYLSLTLALVIVAVVHLGAAFYIVRDIKRRSRNLMFSITNSNL